MLFRLMLCTQMFVKEIEEKSLGFISTFEGGLPRASATSDWKTMLYRVTFLPLEEPSSCLKEFKKEVKRVFVG